MSHITGAPLRVGIVGAGQVTVGSHLPVLLAMADVQIAWVCDRSIDAARKVAQLAGGVPAITDVASVPACDVALVATPVGTRRAIVPALLQRGVHLLCEKPFALDAAEHEEYLALANKAGVQLCVGQLRRYAAATATARRIVRDGAFGPPIGVGAAEGMIVRGTGRSGDWHMTDPAMGGGVLWETGSHLVDQLVYVLDASDVTVESCRQVRRRGIELASSVTATVRTAAGRSIPTVVELSSLDDLCNGLFIEFERCVLKVGFFFGEPLALVGRDGRPLAELVADEGVQDPSQAFHLEWMEFVAQVRTGVPSRLDAASVRCTTALIASAYAIAARDHGERAA